MPRHVTNQPQPRLAIVGSDTLDDSRQKGMRRVRGVIEHDFAITRGKCYQARGEFRVIGGEADPAPRRVVLTGHAGALRAIGLGGKWGSENLLYTFAVHTILVQ